MDLSRETGRGCPGSGTRGRRASSWGPRGRQSSRKSPTTTASSTGAGRRYVARAPPRTDTPPPAPTNAKRGPSATWSTPTSLSLSASPVRSTCPSRRLCSGLPFPSSSVVSLPVVGSTARSLWCPKLSTIGNHPRSQPEIGCQKKNGCRRVNHESSYVRKTVPFAFNDFVFTPAWPRSPPGAPPRPRPATRRPRCNPSAHNAPRPQRLCTRRSSECESHRRW